MQLQAADSSAVHLIAFPVFDLTAIMARVSRENQDWTQERLKNAERGYREFLAHYRAEPGKYSPAPDIDIVWHAHILHTKQYAADCAAYVGHFIHHQPTADDCDAGDECRSQCHVRPGKGCSSDCNSGCKIQCYLRPGKCNVEPN